MIIENYNERHPELERHEHFWTNCISIDEAKDVVLSLFDINLIGRIGKNAYWSAGHYDKNQIPVFWKDADNDIS